MRALFVQTWGRGLFWLVPVQTGSWLRGIVPDFLVLLVLTLVSIVLALFSPEA